LKGENERRRKDFGEAEKGIDTQESFRAQKQNEEKPQGTGKAGGQKGKRRAHIRINKF